MKSFAILKTDSVRPEWAERFGEYPDMFQTVLKRANPNLQFAVYDVQLGEYPDSQDQHGAYLVTGSKAGVYEDHEWLPPLENFVRDLVQADIPPCLARRCRFPTKDCGVGFATYPLCLLYRSSKLRS